jgi:copper amine oxidase-like protein
MRMVVMKRSAVAVILALALGALPVTVPAVYAQSVRVFVDGDPVAFDQPPIITAGRVFVPLRGVFERLGAFVEWDQRTSTVMARQDTTQVILRIGQAQAMVNGQPVTLDAPPMVVGGRTLVPLRFLGETLGARVSWDPSNYTVSIFSTTASPANPPGPAPVNPPAPSAPVPAAPAASIIDGSVARVDRANSRILVQRGDSVLTFVVTPDTVITSGQGSGQVRMVLDQVHPGDSVRVRADANGRAIVIRVRNATAGRELEIASITHDARRPLRAGETVTVSVRGTPNVTATFDIFGIVARVPMREVSRGVYQGAYRIREGDAVNNAVVLARLQNGGNEEIATAETRIAVDAVGPQVMQRMPAADQTINNTRPNIVIAIGDPGGSGIDPAGTRLVVNGDDVTAEARIGEALISYTPRGPLPVGRVGVQVDLVDRAGNQTRDRYAFRISEVQGALIRAITVNPPVLRLGETLTVTAVGQPGGEAAFRVDGFAGVAPMAETNTRGVYTGSMVLGQALSVTPRPRVLVTLNVGGRTETAESTARVTILAADRVPAPRILSPVRGTRVQDRLLVTGTATPGHRVIVRVDYQGVLVLPVSGSYGEVSTTADESGRWSATINRPFRLPNAELRITAVAVDQMGRRSDETVLEVAGG